MKQSDFDIHTESGFFRRANHTDLHGLWAKSSLSLPEAQPIIEAYEAPVKCQDVLSCLKTTGYKYGQKKESVEWTGVVFAAQKPNDRSIRSVSVDDDNDDYWDFFEKACRKYGEHLFVKLHPGNNNLEVLQHTRISNKYGVTVDHSDHRCIEKCKFVLIYNSTFAVDAMLHGRPIVQYAPGYFSGTRAVTFTDHTLPDKAEAKPFHAQKLLDFIIWRYCWYRLSGEEWQAKVHKAFSSNGSLFPLTEEASYAGFIRHCVRTRNRRYVKGMLWPGDCD